MAVREVLTYPDPILKQVCAPAQGEEIERVAGDLIDTMRSYDHCVGLAAPQIGEPVRVAVVDLTGHPKVDEPLGLVVMVNPRVTARSEGSRVGREGCLSLPDLTANVRRPRAATIRHAGGEIEVRGFEARCFLHEIDHLDGVLFLDRVASITDDIFRRKTYR
ncbi:MAG: peptide deformylase [Solirubrobacterales bacterium]|nr:peptide deformylase [Solirubrobacterales bacterium]